MGWYFSCSRANNSSVNEQPSLSHTFSSLFLAITSWNCRGLSTGTSYLQHFLESGSGVVILSEHWLWPYELYKLGEIHPDFHGVGNADRRLTDTSDNSCMGCGGVGILWKKTLDATPITDTQSDRICGIRLKVSGKADAWLSIIGVYLPCQNLGTECYRLP